MSKSLILVWLLVASTAGFSQSLPFDNPQAIHFQPTNVVIRWKAPKHPWPKTLWTYRVIRTQFSPNTISNVLALGPFTEKQKWYSDADTMDFGNRYGAPNLSISFLEGKIDYDGKTQRYSPANLAKDVPPTNQLSRLTLKFLSKIGVSTSEIAKNASDKLKLSWPDDNNEHTLYAVGETTITNVEYRPVSITRALDGVEFRGEGGDASITFGEHGQVVAMHLCWRTVEHEKLYATATPDRLMQWIMEGKAIQKHMLDGHGGETSIDWATVKSFVIKTAKPYYWGDFLMDRKSAHQPLLPCWARPYAELSGTVDNGKANLDVIIVCPIIDESKPLN